MVIINPVIYRFQISDLIKRDALTKIKLGEHGSDPYFPRARASEYSTERGQAYLLSSERVQEFPCRYGRHARFRGSGFEPELRSFPLRKGPWQLSSCYSFATRFRPSLVERCGVVSSCELNTSLPWCLHTSSIKLVFYEYSKRSLFRNGFGLRCFQPLSAST